MIVAIAWVREKSPQWNLAVNKIFLLNMIHDPCVEIQWKLICFFLPLMIQGLYFDVL